MSRRNRSVEGLIPGKIRKRGCSSPASPSSSIIPNYRFKRAILVGKRAGSGTPVPTWKLMGLRSPASALRAADSPRNPQSGGGKVKPQAPVSARKLAATLWEMNETPSLRMDSSEERRSRRELRTRERVARPHHLSDPSHSPVSERMERSGMGSRRRASSISHRLRLTDSLSNASLMEVETRSQAQTPRGSTIGAKTRLKDASNALTTSKELLKIINRMWSQDDRPSSTMSLMSALHAELERARSKVNQLIQEEHSDQNKLNYLMKCLLEEKAAWKSKEREVVRAAVESIAGELETERKLRRRFESLNKKLGMELSETKSSLFEAVKELESEKRAREIVEQVCDELANDGGEVVDLKRESSMEREIIQFEENNAAIDKLRSQLEAFTGARRSKEKGRGSLNHPNDNEIATYFSKSQFVEDEGEVEDGEECKQNSAERERNVKNYKGASTIDKEAKGRKSTSGRVSGRSTSLRRSSSEGFEYERAEGKYSDEMDQYKLMTGLKNQTVTGSRVGSSRVFASPTRQWSQPWPSRDLATATHERPPMVPRGDLKSRLSKR